MDYRSRRQTLFCKQYFDYNFDNLHMNHVIMNLISFMNIITWYKLIDSLLVLSSQILNDFGLLNFLLEGGAKQRAKKERMAEEEDELDDSTYVTIGSAFEQLETDEDVQRAKDRKEKEHYVLDKQGRRRFHGAFTGGFSAGYFNTVGSKEGLLLRSGGDWTAMGI